MAMSEGGCDVQNVDLELEYNLEKLQQIVNF